MLASDVNNPNFTGAMDPDSVMIAKFYKKAIKLEFESEKQGRPIFEDRIYVEYYPAGRTDIKMNVMAHESHKMRFSKQWAYFQATQTGDASIAGTPLDQWAILSPADVENLRGLKFQTIENIAAAPDLALQSLGMGIAGMAPHVLRARAQAYLTSAEDSALPQKQAQDIEALKKQVEQLTAMLQAEAPKKKGRKEGTPEQKAAAAERMKKAREAKGKHGIDATATG